VAIEPPHTVLAHQERSGSVEDIGDLTPVHLVVTDFRSVIKEDLVMVPRSSSERAPFVQERRVGVVEDGDSVVAIVERHGPENEGVNDCMMPGVG